jgi:hypothetical protein
LLPKSNALVTTYTPLLDWSDVTVPLGVTFYQYQVQIAGDLAFSDVVIDKPASSSYYQVELPGLSSNTRYYWRVRAFGNNNAYSAWSSVSYFRTLILPPDLIWPDTGDSGNLTMTTFDWGNVDGASTYTIQFSTTDTFKSLIINKTYLGSYYTPTLRLSRSTPLFWRVRANGINGPSPWSQIRLFNASP